MFGYLLYVCQYPSENGGSRLVIPKVSISAMLSFYHYHYGFSVGIAKLMSFMDFLLKASLNCSLLKCAITY